MQPRQRPPRDVSAEAQRGFTLIELIVTITLLGILVALSLPSFTAWIRNSQVRTVAEALQTGVRTAQAEAVRRNRQVVLSFTDFTPALNATAVPGGKNWSLQSVARLTETYDPEFIGGGALGDVASGVVIADHAGVGISAICFNSNGRLVTNASPGMSGGACDATVTPQFDISQTDISQTNADRPLRVIVQVGGQLRVCDPSRPALSATVPDGCPP